MSTNVWFWIAFHAAVFVVLAVDLKWQKRTPDPVTMGEAGTWSLIWVVLSLSFCGLIWRLEGPHDAVDFLTAYLIEYSLSVDNIFVFVLIFSYFRVPAQFQHRVLMWGIIGALVLRGMMIWLGIALVQRFHFVLYIFGAFLLITGLRMLYSGNTELDLDRNGVLRFCRKWLPITKEYREQHFTARVGGKFMLTPLALVLVIVDVMDLIFAVDSIPAVFAITTDTFIAYTSNICAILGLRSMYFLLAHLVNRFVYLKTGLAIILSFVGVKMLTAELLHLPNFVSLGVIVLVLVVSIGTSMYATKDHVPSQPRI